MEITLEPINENKGRFKLEEDGKQAGFMTYTMARDIMIIDHTEVDPAFEGRGLGKKLVMAGVEHARENNLKIKPLCPFALNVFKRTEAIKDVLF